MPTYEDDVNKREYKIYSKQNWTLRDIFSCDSNNKGGARSGEVGGEEL